MKSHPYGSVYLKALGLSFTTTQNEEGKERWKDKEVTEHETILSVCYRTISHFCCVNCSLSFLVVFPVNIGVIFHVLE